LALTLVPLPSVTPAPRPRWVCASLERPRGAHDRRPPPRCGAQCGRSPGRGGRFTLVYAISLICQRAHHALPRSEHGRLILPPILGRRVPYAQSRRVAEYQGVRADRVGKTHIIDLRAETWVVFGLDGTAKHAAERPVFDKISDVVVEVGSRNKPGAPAVPGPVSGGSTSETSGSRRKNNGPTRAATRR
jgi:hypothetical protein